MTVTQTLHCLAAMTVALAAQPVGAQIGEADRLARCQNNRDALARLEAVRGNYATEEQISPARTALVSIRRLEAEVNRNVAEMMAPRRVGRERVDLAGENYVLDKRIEELAASVNFHCPSNQPACVLTLPQRIAAGIDAAVAQQPLYRQFLQQVAMYNSNLVALRCDQAGGRTITSASTGIPNVAGSWHGVFFDTDYTFSQSGSEVTWSAPSLSETASGRFADGLLTMRWSGVHGAHEASGTVISDANGVATEIRWTNGNVFKRQ